MSIAARRLPMARWQRDRLNGLIKQAADALNIAAEERLNLDTDSRAQLDAARQEISTLDFIAAQQPINTESHEPKYFH